MRKLSLLLTLFSLMACRSPLEATQTVIRIRATDSMQERIKSYKTQVISLSESGKSIEEPAQDAKWPVKRTFVPSSESSSHRFRYVFTAFGETDVPVTTLEIETEVVQGASRYLYILLSDDCLAARCDGGVCKAMIGAAQLRTSPDQAQGLEGSCSGGSLTPPSVTTPPDETMAGTGDGDMAGRDAPTGENNTTTGTAPPTGAAADGGTTSAPDAGPVTPPSTDAECSGDPCGQSGEGECHLNSALPKRYECKCNTGFEPDESASTCVVRNDCLKPDKGGCEDLCDADPTTGEGICSCAGPNRWLKADRKQCASVLEARELTTRGGSLDRTRPQVAFDSEGNGVVVWAETSADGAYSLWTARYRADMKDWEPSRQFMPFTTEAADLQLELDGTGSGVLLWTATVSAKRELWATRYRNGTFEGPAEEVDKNSEGDVLMPTLALDAAGDGLAVWTDTVLPRSKLRVARYHASTGTFSVMDNALDTGDRFVFGTSVAVNNAMGGLIAWTEMPVMSVADAAPRPIFESANAFSSRIGSSLSTGVSFAATGSRSASPDVALDAQGNGVAVWVQQSASSSLRVVASRYVSGMGFGSPLSLHTLSERGAIFSAPRIAMGPDGTSFAAWRESEVPDPTTTTPLHTFGAVRVASGFGPSYELGLPSLPTTWNDIDTAAWTPETTVTALDQLQPSWSTAVGPDHTGFIAGASFTSSAAPATRELWLQRIGAEDEPAQRIPLSRSDTVPLRPSPVRLHLNANGDGAVVWDRQVEGRYHVYVNVLD